MADDEEQVCLDIREMMEDTGVQVAYATGGPAAVDEAERAVARGEEFHVILLDWKMPGQGGAETARQLRAKAGPDIPMLVLTAYDWGDIRDEALAAGVDGFLAKPFFVSTFRQALESLGVGQGGRPAPAPEDALKGLFFLVAEDNELNAEILSEMLDIEGARCEIVPNGRLAVERFNAAPPDRYDPDGRADAGDGRLRGHPAHTGLRRPPGEGDPHCGHDRQRLRRGCAPRPGRGDERPPVQAHQHGRGAGAAGPPAGGIRTNSPSGIAGRAVFHVCGDSGAG